MMHVFFYWKMFLYYGLTFNFSICMYVYLFCLCNYLPVSFICLIFFRSLFLFLIIIILSLSYIPVRNYLIPPPFWNVSCKAELFFAFVLPYIFNSDLPALNNHSVLKFCLNILQSYSVTHSSRLSFRGVTVFFLHMSRQPLSNQNYEFVHNS